MRFPQDHNWHPDARFEWLYTWGRSPGGVFYHKAFFRKEGKRFNHFSLDEDFYENCDEKSQIEIPRDKPVVVHDSKKVNYYSIPGNPWFDHVWGEEVGANWDWVSLVFDDGTCIMAQEKENDRLCDIMLSNGQKFDSGFNLHGDRLHVFKLGSIFFLEPMRKEVIWRPKFGRPYSETPFNIISNGKVLGFGMREKTYKGD